jgi:hypothetical protein
MKEKIMRKTALILIMLTLVGISANLTVEQARGQENGGEVIDFILSESEIVISDTTYRIHSDALFYGTDGKTFIDFRDFKEGDAVAFELNDDGDIIRLGKRVER